jgi:hypothetical protein
LQRFANHPSRFRFGARLQEAETRRARGAMPQQRRQFWLVELPGNGGEYASAVGRSNTITSGAAVGQALKRLEGTREPFARPALLAIDDKPDTAGIAVAKAIVNEVHGQLSANRGSEEK